jgi:pilus assembly protein Flp/PilA
MIANRKEQVLNSCVGKRRGFPMTIRTSCFKFLKNNHGATAIEYSLIAALISVALIAILTATGQRASGVFGEISSAIR